VSGALWKGDVAGSIPASPTKFKGVIMKPTQGRIKEVTRKPDTGPGPVDDMKPTPGGPRKPVSEGPSEGD